MGDCCVGKTAYVNSILTGKFIQKYVATLGDVNRKHTINNINIKML